MKLIKAIIRPDKLHDVLHALYEADVQGLTVSRVKGHGGEPEVMETYRGAKRKRELQDKVLLDIGVSDSFVETTVEAISEAARTGEVGDGKVFVQPLESAYRIRTGEKGEDAVTPVEQ
jgi:nitrogen regulatory protein P-II 1